MPISQGNINVFWSNLITMVPEWNHFLFIQIDYPRWPPGAVTKNSMNTKMIISEEPLVVIDPTLPECFLYETVLIFLMELFQIYSN